jgi:peptidylprolyl isomerase
VKTLVSILALCALLAVAGCGGSDSNSSTESTAVAKKIKPDVSVPKGPPPKKLVVKEIEEGTGAAAKAYDVVTVQYVGVNYKSGEEFDSSWSRQEPFTFNLGTHEVIRGWDQGLVGMRVGGRRELIVPPDLGYGATGTGSIPPNETLVFVVDLLSIE